MIYAENVEQSVGLYNCLKNSNSNTLKEVKMSSNNCETYEMKIIDWIIDNSKKVENIFFYDEQYGYYSDRLISDLNISGRVTNALINSKITLVSELLNTTLNDFENIKKLGEKSKSEILNFLKQKIRIIYSNKNSIFIKGLRDKVMVMITNEFDGSLIEFDVESLRFEITTRLEQKSEYDYENEVGSSIESILTKDDICKLYETEFCKKIFKNQIFNWLDEQSDMISFDKINNLFPKHISKTKLIVNLVNDMVNENILEEINSKYRIYYKTLEETILGLEDERDTIILINRLEGKTLEEIGKTLEVTRERIRQREKKAIKKIQRVREDDLKGIFERYEWSKEVFLMVFNVDIKVFNYLNIKYRNGNISLEKALSDCNISIKARQKIERYIYRDYLLIGNNRVKKDKQEILFYVLKTFCKDEVSIEELSEYYAMFLEDYDLIDDKYSFPVRYFESTLSCSLKVIWKFKKKLRFFDFSEFDEEKIISMLDLENYKNLEISSLKIFNDHIDIMKEWDIRDEYELHNLMKKIMGDSNCYDIKFLRMPNIKFGTADRDMQVLELLIQSSPIENIDLAKIYEAEYGVKKETVLANHFKVIEEYYHDGKYSIEYKSLDKNELNEMKKVLNDDIYLLNEVKALYKRYFSSGDTTRINPYSLRSLGFKITSLFIYSDKYNSLDEYFKKLISKNEIFDANRLIKRFGNYQSFYNVIYSMKINYDVIEFEPNVYISSKRLEKIGVMKADILDFIECVDNFINEEIFTMKLLRNRGFDHYLFNLGFDDWFYSSILKCNERFKSRRMGQIIILKKCNDSIVINDLIEYIVSKFRKIDIYELIDYVYENYGVKINRDKITTIVADKELYYDAIMEKVYIDYDEYFEEV